MPMLNEALEPNEEAEVLDLTPQEEMSEKRAQAHERAELMVLERR
jgi:hypothetical protein